MRYCRGSVGPAGTQDSPGATRGCKGGRYLILLGSCQVRRGDAPQISTVPPFLSYISIHQIPLDNDIKQAHNDIMEKLEAFSELYVELEAALGLTSDPLRADIAADMGLLHREATGLASALGQDWPALLRQARLVRQARRRLEQAKAFQA